MPSKAMNFDPAPLKALELGATDYEVKYLCRFANYAALRTHSDVWLVSDDGSGKRNSHQYLALLIQRRAEKQVRVDFLIWFTDLLVLLDEKEKRKATTP
jgi:hypothetical protein